ncbi:S8 family serine peptidase [Sorangium cellulosum]|uniref:S8 family serine peptidase n=1 Tax=Sorangium cellulosum TaxID=56 RepID=UPI002277FFFB|nr:S8 family serine peptidase [Sorangium cellulosum]
MTRWLARASTSHPTWKLTSARCRPRRERWRSRPWSEPHGHGTHVAGTILGSGKASDGAYQGIAPDARLVFQSLLDPRGRLGGLPVDLGDLLRGPQGFALVVLGPLVDEALRPG